MEHQNLNTEENANSDLDVVSGSPSFDEWLDKYFKTPKLKMMYMRKDGKEEFDRETLLKRYKRAYKPSQDCLQLVYIRTV